MAVAVAVTTGWAVVVAWWTPRGPLTTGQALWSMLISLAVGYVAAFSMRSRWAITAAPLAFAVVFEVARLGTGGPLVDGFRWSTYGLLAFGVGRGVHGVLALGPMMLGAVAGAGGARWLDATHPTGHQVWRWARRAVAATAAVAMLGLVWYPMIDAPDKDVTYLDTSGHRPLFEQPDEFVDYMVGTVLERTGAA